MSKKVHIHFLSGKRGGFGAMLPLLRLLNSDSDFSVSLILTDQHLSKDFGETYKEVVESLEDSIPIFKLDMMQAGGTTLDRASALARLQVELTKLLATERPDALLIYGDRGESLVGATVATFLNITIVHLQGGDVSGSVDEWVRHAITKLAHIHYPSTQKSLERLIQMGEEQWRCIAVGDNHLDGYKKNDFAEWKSTSRELGLSLNKSFIIILQHSETTQPEQSYDHMVETLKSVQRFKSYEKVVLYPCSDAGYDGIIRAIKERCNSDDFHIFKNLRASVFRTLLKQAAAIVGNSSAGLIEAPYVGTPTINIGRRQSDRERGLSVIDVEHVESDVSRALEAVLQWPSEQRYPSPYQINNNRTAAELIAETLLGQLQTKNVRIKKFHEKV